MIENEVSNYRAEVIEKTIALESLISVAITINYFGHINQDFLLEVLYDENFNSGLKLNILKKAFPDKIDNKVENKIRKIFGTRNIFAHNHNLKIYNGEKWVVVNPRKYNSGNAKAKEKGESIKGIDFQQLFEEFNKLITEVRPLLETLIPKK
jgi:hypothetical protein